MKQKIFFLNMHISSVQTMSRKEEKDIDVDSQAYIYSPKSILVTGCAGFLGSHLSFHLVKKFPDVIVTGFDDFGAYSLADKQNLAGIDKFSNFKLVEGSLSSPDLVRHIITAHKVKHALQSIFLHILLMVMLFV